MARDNYTFELTCACGETGTAWGSDDDNGPNFTVDSTSDDFGTVGHSPNPWAQQFRHRGCPKLVTALVKCD